MKRAAALTAIVGWLLVSSCSRDRDSHAVQSLDIKQLAGSSLEVDTQRIDLRIGGNADRHLLRGWLQPLAHFTWMTGPESHVGFYNYAVGRAIGVQFAFDVSAFRGTGFLDVRANDVEVGRFELAPGNSRKRSVTIPADVTQSGLNVLVFRFVAANTNPSGGSGVKPIALKSIVFDTQRHLELHEDGAVIQRKDSEFRLFAELPREFEIESDYEIEGESIASVSVGNDSGEVHRFTLEPAQRKLTESVSFQHAGPFQFVFGTRGPAASSIAWNEFRVRFETPAQDAASRVQAAKPETDRRPDIFLYVIDTLRADHLGSYGYSRRTSPNIDKLASEGVLFENAFSNSSWTRTSAASILTGLFPKHHRTLERGDKLPANLMTLAERLKTEGYKTAAFISNGNLIPTFGFDQGFDTFEDLSDNLEEPALLSYLSDHINESVFRYLERHATKAPRAPLFVMVWTIDPHFPYAPRENVADKFGIERYEPIDTFNNKLFRRIRKRKVKLSRSQIQYMIARYDQEIFFNDLSFGAFVRKLEEKDLYSDAMTIFTSDHGEEFFDHGFVGHGRTLYGEQVEIPLIIKGPGFGKGERSARRVQHIDIYPTLMEIVNSEGRDAVDGISLLSDRGSKRDLFFEQELDDVDIAAMLGSDRKLVFNKNIERPLATEELPTFEVFSRDDRMDQKNLGVADFTDQLNVQRLLAYLKQRERGVESQKVIISEPLDERLKALGYAR